MNILDSLIDKERIDYKCYETLRNLYFNNIDFKRIIDEGFLSGHITGFSEDIWDKICEQNIRGIPNFEDVFRDGANIGYCTVASKQLSYSFNSCYICGGILPVLKGTINCPDGSHTWILYDEKIIDTTLMLIIDESYAKNVGYIEENRYDPNIDLVYLATKEFTNDKSFKK